MMGCQMRSENTDENTVDTASMLSGEADYETAVNDIIGRFSERWRVSGKVARPVAESDGWFPLSRPRRGCEDC